MIKEELYTVIESDLDELGHMNFNRYVLLFSEVRMNWFAHLGITLEDLVARSLGTAIITFNATYHQELRLGDTVTIETKLIKVGTKSFTMEQKMLRNGELCADTTVVLVIMDLKARKAIPVPEEIAACLVK